MRIALGLEYDGSGFSGWQTQPGQRTVEDVLARAVGAIARERVRLVCSGRTDSGVHALDQVVHFDTGAERPRRAWVQGVNACLPPDVRVHWANVVAPDFSARLSAVARRYRYLLQPGRVASALSRERAAWVRRPLDIPRMAEAARHLLGEHDFSAFRASACQARSPVRTVYRIDVSRADDLVRVDVEANAFLHHMVRNVVGALITVGTGEHDAAWLSSVLAGRDRTRSAATAPAHGLYLAGVRYPGRYAIPPCESCQRFA